jgi:hypothetical protein
MTEHAEAVRRASPVSASIAAGGMLQRKCACGNATPAGSECPECRGKRLQRKTTGAEAKARIPAIVHEVLAGSGRPLDPATRAFMEPRFGRDLAQVRVHDDPMASRSADAVGALAYTVGSHVAFAAGHYAPASAWGRRLLAHELAHTIQQSEAPAGLQASGVIGDAGTPAEIEADRVADRVAEGGTAPPIGAAIPAPIVQRQPKPGGADAGDDLESEPDFSAPQQRAGRGRAAYLDAGKRGEDTVRIAIVRYLCGCIGRNVTEKSAKGQLKPPTGFTLEFCHGRLIARLTGDIVPSSVTTGRATVRGEINVAPGKSGVGVKAGVEGEARNTGAEPQVGGRADVRVKPSGKPEVGVGGEVFRGQQTGRIDTKVGVGVDVGGARIGGNVTNPQDRQRMGFEVTLGVDLPGQNVETRICRHCRCPTAYTCYEDIPPRDYEEPVDYEVEQQERMRYYFALDTARDTGVAELAAASNSMVDEVARRVAAGAKVRSITGYASPEDNRDRPVPNQQLSLSRARRLRERLDARLGKKVALPEPQSGGELFGRVATVEPGSRLADAIVEAGFGGPEDVSAFLIGSGIPDKKLADEFLGLLERVDKEEDRLRLFGLSAESKAAPRLLKAIDQFVRSRGRGRRPWEDIFGYLRFATVELGESKTETRMESRRTTGSLKEFSGAECERYARQAEDEGKFGPAEPEPKTGADCASETPRNASGSADKCKYDD